MGSPENAFIREVTGPELRVVLGFNWQLREIVRFCTNCTKFSVLGVDPTFNLGKFHQTVTTYSSLVLLDRKTGKHSMMIGPMLRRQRKTFESYNFFFSKLVGMNKDMAAVLAFRTDGEEALTYFYHARHLRCFTHFKNNCKELLKLIPHGVETGFLSDVFWWNKEQDQGRRYVLYVGFNIFALEPDFTNSLPTCNK